MPPAIFLNPSTTFPTTSLTIPVGPPTSLFFLCCSELLSFSSVVFRKVFEFY